MNVVTFGPCPGRPRPRPASKHLRPASSSSCGPVVLVNGLVSITWDGDRELYAARCHRCRVSGTAASQGSAVAWAKTHRCHETAALVPVDVYGGMAA